jgi:hypothetical protein
MGDRIKGQCMCGAVTVAATRAKPIIRACHCDMCRRWTSSMFMSIPTDPASIEVDGPVRTFRSSDWAERAFCDTCGSALWYMTVHDQTRQLAAGLFEDAAGNTLAVEFFGDQCPQGYALGGDHRRMTAAETLAMFAREGSS